jgi:hypothetical protein
MSHGDKVTAMPAGFKVMASTPACPIAGMADEARKFYAVQFHPEVTHTVQGQALLNRFVLDICQARQDWIMGDYIEEAVAKIHEQVGDEEVILGLSGGVERPRCFRNVITESKMVSSLGVGVIFTMAFATSTTVPAMLRTRSQMASHAGGMPVTTSEPSACGVTVGAATAGEVESWAALVDASAA